VGVAGELGPCGLGCFFGCRVGVLGGFLGGAEGFYFGLQAFAGRGDALFFGVQGCALAAQFGELLLGVLVHLVGVCAGGLLCFHSTLAAWGAGFLFQVRDLPFQSLA
jgi:hypothetical protein